MFQIGSIKIPHRLIMAPMCGITLKPFRMALKEFGAPVVMTQMVSAKALTLGDAKTRFLLSYDSSERPIGFQIFGNNADTLMEAARMAQDLGPDFIDLNMGCPAKKIVSDGGGSAMLRDPQLCRDVFQKMRAVLKIPFTIKMRSGWDKDHGITLEIAKMAESLGVDAITLHARTKAQGYSGKSDWNLIRTFKEILKIPVIGNGDVTTLTEANRMLSETGCDAVMIGRAAVSSPWFFKSYLDQKEYQPTLEELKNLILKQYESFFEFFGINNGIKMMRKHLCAYTKGVKDGSQFRNKIVPMDDWTVLRQSIEDFFKVS